MNKEEIWSKWSQDIHDSEDSKKRIISAQKADLTPISVNSEDCFAYFQGGHGRYETFLDQCPCGDFIKRRLPCKHIYRLAMELGLIAGNPVNDATKIKVPKVKGGLGICAALDIIEKCSDKAQILALDIFSSAASGTYKYYAINDSETQELLQHKIVHIVPDEDNSLKDELIDKYALIEKLMEAGCKVRSNTADISTLKSLFEEHFPGALANIYSDSLILEIEDNFSNVKKNIFRYLKRKFDPEKYYDDNMNLSPYYPDDEITALLISRGYLHK